MVIADHSCPTICGWPHLPFTWRWWILRGILANSKTFCSIWITLVFISQCHPWYWRGQSHVSLSNFLHSFYSCKLIRGGIITIREEISMPLGCNISFHSMSLSLLTCLENKFSDQYNHFCRWYLMQCFIWSTQVHQRVLLLLLLIKACLQCQAQPLEQKDPPPPHLLLRQISAMLNSSHLHWGGHLAYSRIVNNFMTSQRELFCWNIFIFVSGLRSQMKLLRMITIWFRFIFGFSRKKRSYCYLCLEKPKTLGLLAALSLSHTHTFVSWCGQNRHNNCLLSPLLL